MFMCIHIQVYAKEKEILLTFGISSMYCHYTFTSFLGGGYYIHVKTTKSNQLKPCLQHLLTLILTKFNFVPLSSMITLTAFNVTHK